ncbi:MAG: TetR/AcrR family transcriptional regulator [Spirochaetes bacterium]|nr:TetR/AcrR family transcriptional regulator [Spirochaetota bacterium]
MKKTFDKMHNKEQLFFIVQKLKSEIESAILIAAQNQFFAEGFNNATMRSIADAAGIHVSNLYLYFKNKEALFNRIVTPFQLKFDKNLKAFFDHNDDKKSIHENIKTLVKIFTVVIREERKLFIILFDKSEGTKFKTYKENQVRFLADHIKNEINQPFNPEILLIIINNLFNCFIHVAKISKTNESIEQNLTLVLQYHVSGISGFIN